MLILTMLVSGAAAQDDEIENMVKNPDFDDNLTGWTIGSIADGAAGQLVLDKHGVSGERGDNCLFARIDGVGNDAWEPEIHSPQFDVELGETYTVSLWAKTEEDGVRPIGVKFEQLETWVGPSKTFTLTDEWTEYHFTTAMTMASPPAVVIHIQFNNLKDDVWFDHFKVYMGEYVPEELEGQQRISVTPMGSLAATWGRIRSR
jgi:hypothetical protein